MAKPSRRGRGAITIEDVARAAGVSAMTVSRVINQGKNVRESTRAAVLEAIEQLNYSPNTAARSLAAGRGDAYRPALCQSERRLSQPVPDRRACTRRAVPAFTSSSNPANSEDADEQAEVTRRFATSDVEGVILPPPLSESQPILAELDAMRHSGRHRRHGRAARDSLNVRIDDHAAAMEMTRYLLDLGHRKIGFIKGHPNHVASHDRLPRLLRRADRSRHRSRRGAVEQGYFSYRSGLIAGERLLSRDRAADGDLRQQRRHGRRDDQRRPSPWA